MAHISVSLALGHTAAQGNSVLRLRAGAAASNAFHCKSVRVEIWRKYKIFIAAPYIRLRAIITLKRSFPFYLYHVYIPGALLVVLSFTTFFIPPSAIPARVTLIVTNFLSTLFIFGGTSSLIPKKPYITAMEIYLLTNIVFIILVMIEYIFVLQLKALRNKRFKVSFAHTYLASWSSNAGCALDSSLLSMTTHFYAECLSLAFKISHYCCLIDELRSS